jgi:hypothetical protein
VGGASTEGTGPWVEHTVDPLPTPFRTVLGVALLKGLIGVVVNKEVPLDGFIFGSKGVEDWYVIVVRETILVGIVGIAASEEAGVAAGL